MADRWWLNADGLAVTQTAKMMLILRMRHAGAAQFNMLGAAFGVVWPSAPTACVQGAVSVFWLSPEEWLIAGAEVSDVIEKCATACADAVYHLADISEGRVVFSVTGVRSRELIAKGCSLDLHPRVFGSGRCALTLLAQAPILIALTDGQTDSFDVVADISLARYMKAWFEAAAVEYAK